MITHPQQLRGRRLWAIALILAFPLGAMQSHASAFFTSKNDTTQQLQPEKSSIFDHLQQAQPLKITITTDLDALVNDRKRTDYQEGQMVIAGASGTLEERPIEIKPRGKYRRRVCDFPPVKISFKKANLQSDGLDPTFDDIKLVTHCLDNRGEGNANVLREYLIYKLYALLTEKSFRVQLAEVTYQDSNRKSGKIERYAFLIEDSDQLAQRLGGKDCEGCMNPDLTTIPEEELAMLSVFQFMIGNADWNLRMLRNLKLIKKAGEREDVLVPYDFDFAGMVDASYAIPNPDYELSSTRQRVFLGPPVSDEAMRRGIDRVAASKEEIRRLVDGFDLLPRREREDIRAYLDSFFEYLDQLNLENSQGVYEQFRDKKLAYSNGKDDETP